MYVEKSAADVPTGRDELIVAIAAARRRSMELRIEAMELDSLCDEWIKFTVAGIAPLALVG